MKKWYSNNGFFSPEKINLCTWNNNISKIVPFPQIIAHCTSLRRKITFLNMSDVVWVLVFLIKMSLNYMHISRCFIHFRQVFQLSTRLSLLTFVCLYCIYTMIWCEKIPWKKLPTRLLSTQVYSKVDIVVRIEKIYVGFRIPKICQFLNGFYPLNFWRVYFASDKLLTSYHTYVIEMHV